MFVLERCLPKVSSSEMSPLQSICLRERSHVSLKRDFHLREVSIFEKEHHGEVGAKNRQNSYLRKWCDDWQSRCIRSHLDFYWIKEVIVFICLEKKKQSLRSPQ